MFEWGAGGIMHLHSINFGSRMPRVDPTAAGMQQPDEKTAEISAQFAEMHEEYLTDWSFAKAEKKFFAFYLGLQNVTRVSSFEVPRPLPRVAARPLQTLGR